MKTKQMIAIAMMNEKANSQLVRRGFQRKSNTQVLISVSTNAGSLKSWTESLWSAIKALRILQ